MMQPIIAIKNPVKWLSADFNSLKTLNQNIISFYNSKIKQYVSTASITLLYQQVDTLD
jgi:hypothetical protein